MKARKKAHSGPFFRAVEGILLGIFHATELLFRHLHPRVLDLLFAALGHLAYYAMRGMRSRLLAKLSQGLPEMGDSRELKRIAREVCSSALRPIYDLFLFGTHEQRFMSGLHVEGMENLNEAESRGRGVLLLGAHLGAFTLRLAVMMRLGKPYTAVMFHPDDSPLPRYVRTMAEYGSSLGYDEENNPVVFAGKDAISRIEERLRDGGTVSINFDVDGGFVVDFMGRPAALAGGAAHFALNTGAAIVPFSLQRGERLFDHQLKIHAPLDFTLSGDRARDLAAIMDEVAGAGEAMICEAPGQWMSWFGLWHWWEKAEEIR